jgi:phosphatidylglycerol:prolipoprotein diacylglycerol transferase
MFPRISDLFYVWFGWDFLLPIQSFGFMVAICFIVAYYVLTSELRRKQKQGIFPTRMVKVKKGGPIPATDILIQFLIFGLVGYKLGLMIEDYEGFANDTQGAILSTKGSMMYALIFGVLAAAWQVYLYNKRKNDKATIEKEEHGILNEMGVVMTIAFVGGILGAKIFHNLEYWDQFIQDPIRALFSFDGLTFYGGLIVAGLGIAWYVRKKGYNALAFADATAPGLMLGYGIGRIGCQLAGDGDWGIANTAPKPGWLSWAPDWTWAFTYPHNVIKEGVRMAECDPHWGEYCNELATPVFPTPFYETLMAVALFFVLWAFRKRLPYIGQMFGLYLVANGLERFFIEKIRVNATYNLFGAEITQAEIISTLLVLGGIALFSLATFKWKFQASQSDPEPVK